MGYDDGAFRAIVYSTAAPGASVLPRMLNFCACINELRVKEDGTQTWVDEQFLVSSHFSQVTKESYVRYMDHVNNQWKWQVSGSKLTVTFDRICRYSNGLEERT